MKNYFKMLEPIKLIMLSAIFLIAIGCKKDKEEELSSQSKNGKVEGVIYSGNGEVPLAAVKVFVDVEGEVYLTQTDKAGKFSLSCPAGDHLLYMHSGDGKLFFNTTNISVKTGQTSTLSGGSTVLTQQGALAYIPGYYDDIQSIVTFLGYSIDEIAVPDLLDLNTLEQYDAIFLNCGMDGQLEGQMYQNLETYLSGGGSLYASDFAVEYLTGDGNINNMTPHHHDNVEEFELHKTCVSQQGGFVPNNMLCTQKQGVSGMLNNVDVVDNDIQLVVGNNNMDINYNLGGWEVIRNLGSEFDVLIDDNTNYGPLAVRSNGTAPWAQSSSGGNNNGGGNNGNSNNQFVTICHIPPGNPGNPQTITISVNALQAHLDHGCYVGSCQGDGGQVFYTTFHNSPQSGVSQDVTNILQYFIMNL
jgi:hypothetical protein